MIDFDTSPWKDDNQSNVWTFFPQSKSSETAEWSTVSGATVGEDSGATQSAEDGAIQMRKVTYVAYFMIFMSIDNSIESKCLFEQIL